MSHTKPSVVIVGVTGVGDLAREAVQLQNSGGMAAMLGWRLDDGHGEEYVFPALTLHQGALRVYSRAGDDSSIELFWGLDHPVWAPGATITLRDAAGVTQSTFTIPASG